MYTCRLFNDKLYITELLCKSDLYISIHVMYTSITSCLAQCTKVIIINVSIIVNYCMYIGFHMTVFKIEHLHTYWMNIIHMIVHTRNYIPSVQLDEHIHIYMCIYTSVYICPSHWRSSQYRHACMAPVGTPRGAYIHVHVLPAHLHTCTCI